jgi:WD repeat-containing protein 19
LVLYHFQQAQHNGLQCLQELLLRSSRPLAALEMRRDLKHWPQALALAQQLAPGSIAALSKEHAAMLEMVGEHAEARTHYQQVRRHVIAG